MSYNPFENVSALNPLPLTIGGAHNPYEPISDTNPIPVEVRELPRDANGNLVANVASPPLLFSELPAAASVSGSTRLVMDPLFSGPYEFRSNGSMWLPVGGLILLPLTGVAMLPKIVFGGASATYSQTATTVTVTQTPHSMTAILHGGNIHTRRHHRRGGARIAVHGGSDGSHFVRYARDCTKFVWWCARRSVLHPAKAAVAAA